VEIVVAINLRHRKGKIPAEAKNRKRRDQFLYQKEEIKIILATYSESLSSLQVTTLVRSVEKEKHV
jgi:hypothetical protein